MGLELLTQADFVLNACGRPMPPRGYKFVDLPKVIPFHAVFSLPAFDFPAAPDSGNGEFIISSLGSPNLICQATNNAGSPVGATVQGNLITVNIPNNTTTVNAVVAALNGNPAFAAVAIAAVIGDGTKFAQTAPTSIVIEAVAPPPTQNRVENTTNTLFIVLGISLITDPVAVRIRWPNGTFWNQFPSGNVVTANSTGFPQGVAGNMIALDEPVIIPKGGKVSIEMSGGNPGTVDIALWGKVRYLLKDTGPTSGGEVDGQTCIVGYPSEAQPQGAPNCLIGYPVQSPGKANGAIITMPDPVLTLKERPRVNCWPNQNIMAPEWFLGNQCFTDTPPGFEDESFTFFSGQQDGGQPIPIVLNAANGYQNFNNAVGVPGTQDVIIKRWRAIATWADGATANITAQLRSPTGYSVTGGDQIPFWLEFWLPVFPTLNMRAGTNIILDVSAQEGQGSISVVFEFDAVKRRRIV